MEIESFNVTDIKLRPIRMRALHLVKVAVIGYHLLVHDLLRGICTATITLVFVYLHAAVHTANIYHLSIIIIVIIAIISSLSGLQFAHILSHRLVDLRLWASHGRDHILHMTCIIVDLCLIWVVLQGPLPHI